MNWLHNILRNRILFLFWRYIKLVILVAGCFNIFKEPQLEWILCQISFFPNYAYMCAHN